MRKEKKIIKRGIAVALQAVLIAGAIVGCGKNKGSEESLVNQAANSSKDYVFRAEQLDNLPEGDYNSLQMVGGRVYTSTYGSNGFFDVYSFNPDGSDVRSLRFAQKDNEGYSSWAFDQKGNMYCLHYIYDWSEYGDDEPILYTDESGKTEVVLENKTVDVDPEAPVIEDTEGTEDADSSEDNAEKEVAIQNDNGEFSIEVAHGDNYLETDGDQQYLVKFDNTGKEIFNINLADYQVDGDYYVYSMIYDEKYGVLLSSSRGIEKLNEDNGSIETIVDTRDQSSELYDRAISLFKGSKGQFFIYSWGDKGIEFRSFDPATKKFGEISSAFTGYNDYSFFIGEGYDIYVSENDGFYGYDASKDTLAKILDYMDSDLGISFSTSSAIALSETEFIANIPDEDYNYTLYRLVKVPADQIKDKKIITLAGDYLNYDIRRKAATFNQQNDEYRIKIVDYSSLDSDDDWNAGKTQMNLDIVSGNTPDIMIFDAEDSLSSYINKGLFLDLGTLIENDPELKNEKFVENVIEALKVNGKLYQIPESFYVESVATKTRYLEGKKILSIKDCDDIISRAGTGYDLGFGITSRENMLTSGLGSAGKNYIDWENKSCNFDSDEFIEFLEFVNKFPEEIKESSWDAYTDTCYRDGSAVFSNAYIYSFRSYKRMEQGEFGESITMVGYPNDFGMNCSIICPNNRFAISSQSKNADGAWEFVREFLTPEAQDKIEYDFPILQSSFDKMAEKSMERDYYLDDDGNKHYEDDTYYMGDVEIVIPPLTGEEVDTVKEFIYSIDKIMDYDDSVYKIITEEVSAYFSGQKTAKEVAQIIQSRVSIYVHENS